ncbi:hypothetical protein U9M48_005668, partial [Paspalum notatum var. saurae]
LEVEPAPSTPPPPPAPPRSEQAHGTTTPRVLASLLLLVLLPCSLAATHQAPQPAAGEAALLLKIKSSWGNPPVLAGWNTSSAAGVHYCDWPYVGCDTAGRVASLTLASAGITGPFPHAIGNLSALTYLDLYNNSILGAFPTALYRCASIEYLDLSRNNLTGELPSKMGLNLGKSVTTLFLDDNLFSSTILSSLGSLKRLQRLDLSTTRELPASFKNLANLTFLGARNCNLVGEFPSLVLEMPELEVLFLGNNVLTGSIPTRVWSLHKLLVLDLSRNNFTGGVVVDDGNDMASRSLTHIDMSWNYKHSDLGFVEVWNNALTGAIPEGLRATCNCNWPHVGCDTVGRVANLTLASAGIMGPFPDAIGDLSALTYLDISSNNISGVFPTTLYCCASIEYLDLSHNNLTDELPLDIGRSLGQNLTTLVLDGNLFSGAIPPSLGSLTGLRTLIYIYIPKTYIQPAEIDMAPPRRKCWLLLLQLALLLPCSCLAAPQPAAGEAVLLLKIKSSWGNPPVLAGWNTSSAAGVHYCDWPYVGCDTAGRVASLTLASAGITGPFPHAIGNLSALTYLDLYNNSILGAFPTALYRCASIEYLDLSYNNFTGELPPDIGRSLGQNLTTLVLDDNLFSGAIPPSLGLLKRLQTLCLSDNPFDAGELPASFKNLTNLTIFCAGNCNLIGEFPSSVLQMSELELLDLFNNALTGSIPPRLWSLRKLQILNLSYNNFTGDLVVDDGNGTVARSLTEIDISWNYKLTGTIPKAFGLFENLTLLYLMVNNFSGEIPASIARLPSMWNLVLNNNQFTGTLPTEFGKHSDLGYLDVGDNALTGAIPEGLCARGQFIYFRADNNHLNGSIPLTGAIPQDLCAGGGQLDYLGAENNRLNGSIPSGLANSNVISQITSCKSNGTELRELGLAYHLHWKNIYLCSNAKAMGPFPDAIGDLSALTSLDLSNNNILNAFSTALYHSASIEYLNSSHNNLTGKLPSDIDRSLGQNLTAIFLYNNRFSGAIPSSLGSLTRLQGLSLSNNPFNAGELLASFKNLANLAAGNCNLVGEFPSSVLEMPEVLVLSNNALTGSMPPRVWSLSKLWILDLSANKFITTWWLMACSQGT